MSVYQMMHWRTTTWTMSVPALVEAEDEDAAPLLYMPRSSGMPMTSVLGSVEREKSVMLQSRPRK